MQAIAAQVVDPNNTTSCQELVNILVESQHDNEETEIVYINKESASKLYKELFQNKPDLLKLHVQLCTINEEVVFKREDRRVSKEILLCKVLIEHQQSS